MFQSSICSPEGILSNDKNKRKDCFPKMHKSYFLNLWNLTGKNLPGITSSFYSLYLDKSHFLSANVKVWKPKVSPQNAQIPSAVPTPAMPPAALLSQPHLPCLLTPHSPWYHQSGIPYKRAEGKEALTLPLAPSTHYSTTVWESQTSEHLHPGLLSGIGTYPPFLTETALTSYSIHQSLQMCNTSMASTVTAPQMYPNVFLL